MIVTLGPVVMLLLGVKTGAQGRILQFCPGHLFARGVIVTLGPDVILLLEVETGAQGRIPKFRPGHLCLRGTVWVWLVE